MNELEGKNLNILVYHPSFMSIDEVMQRNTIEFDPPLILEDVEELLVYVAKHLPAKISYDACYGSYINGYSRNNKGPRMQGGSVKGTIRKKDDATFDQFEFELANKKPLSAGSMHFFTVPGWELNEYRPEVVKLWDDVRILVDKYFDWKNVSIFLKMS